MTSNRNQRVKVREYNAVFQEESDGGYSVWVPMLPGCCSQGDSFEEAMMNIKEAVELYLEDEPLLAHDSDESKEKQFLVPIRINYA